MSASTDLVDLTIDSFFKYQLKQRKKKKSSYDAARRAGRTHLVAAAAWAGHEVDPEVLSVALQDYRLEQIKGTTKYVVACQGYARKARWVVIDGEGLNKQRSAEERMRHTNWVTYDLARRAASDTLNELVPGLEDTDAIVSVISDAVEDMQATLRLLAQRVENHVALSASVLFITVPELGDETAEEAAVLATLGDDAPDA